MATTNGKKGSGKKSTKVEILTETIPTAPLRSRSKRVKETDTGTYPTIEQIVSILAKGNLGSELLELIEESRLRSGDERTLIELSSLARNIRRTVEYLRRTADSVEFIANDVLQDTGNLCLCVDQEADSINSTVSSIEQISTTTRAVAEAINALSNLAQTTSTSSLEMAASIDEVSTNADALTAFVEDTASAIEEMAASVRNVASSTESLAVAADQTERSMRAIDESSQQVGLSVSETAVLAEEVHMSSEQGSAIVLETTASMRSVRRGIEEAAETVAALGERSERIGAITRVIEEIADRTNLLALNARILAAQAGQQGRGFAVVAEEIKELSERTARSTQEIDQLIKGVRESVETAIGQSSTNRQLADEGVRLAERAASSLNEISSKTAAATSAIRQIAEAAANQSLESHQVTELAAQVRHRAQEIERATSEQARTSQQIGERAVRMAELTEQVRRAMQEQAAASKHIAQAMESLTEVVNQTGIAIKEQYHGAEEALSAIEAIRHALIRNQASIRQINYITGLLHHEVNSLRESTQHFQLPSPNYGGKITYAVPKHNASLDPTQNSITSSSDILNMVLEGLVRVGTNSEIEPALATHWEISSDGQVYTFHLRQGVHFHNGRELETEDVIYSIKRGLKALRTSSRAFINLLGAQDFIKGETGIPRGVRAIDKYTIELELTTPLAFFLPMLAMRCAAIVPREESNPDNETTSAQSPTGTGPFRIVDVTNASDRIELIRFEDYWDKRIPYADQVSVEFSQYSENLFDRVQNGELTILHEIAADKVEHLLSDPEWSSCTVIGAPLHTQFIVFDAKRPPFDDVRVRRAIAHAIDKQQLIQRSYPKIAIAAAGPIPPGLLGYDANYTGLQYNPELARQLLKEAGYNENIEIDLWRSSEEEAISKEAGEIICRQLKEVGIKCNIQIADSSELLNAISDGRAQMADISWFANYADPDDFIYGLFHSTNHQVGFERLAQVKEVDHLSEQARILFSRNEREEIYKRVQRLLVEDAVCAFLTHRRTIVVHNRKVEGLTVHLIPPFVRPQEIWLSK
jgi:ABC-type transport system substrate-binding protein/methyl-accepting chemotaxis protein